MKAASIDGSHDLLSAFHIVNIEMHCHVLSYTFISYTGKIKCLLTRLLCYGHSISSPSPTLPRNATLTDSDVGRVGCRLHRHNDL